MANDRLMLTCRCGAMKMLGKYYPSIARYGVDTSDWVTEHLETCVDGAPVTLKGENPISLTTEVEMTPERWRQGMEYEHRRLTEQ